MISWEFGIKQMQMHQSHTQGRNLGLQNHQNRVSKCLLFIIDRTGVTDFKPTVQKGLWSYLPFTQFLSNRAPSISNQIPDR